MIKDNVLRFGDGDIAVDGGISEYGVLKFQMIKPPQEVGTSVAWGTECISEPVKFQGLCSLCDIALFVMRIKEGGDKRFAVGEWIFDFETSFNIKSVEVVIKHSRKVLEQILIASAC